MPGAESVLDPGRQFRRSEPCTLVAREVITQNFAAREGSLFGDRPKPGLMLWILVTALRRKRLLTFLCERWSLKMLARPVR